MCDTLPNEIPATWFIAIDEKTSPAMKRDNETTDTNVMPSPRFLLFCEFIQMFLIWMPYAHWVFNGSSRICCCMAQEKPFFFRMMRLHSSFSRSSRDGTSVRRTVGISNEANITGSVQTNMNTHANTLALSSPPLSLSHSLADNARTNHRECISDLFAWGLICKACAPLFVYRVPRQFRIRLIAIKCVGCCSYSSGRRQRPICYQPLPFPRNPPSATTK